MRKRPDHFLAAHVEDIAREFRSPKGSDRSVDGTLFIRVGRSAAFHVSATVGIKPVNRFDEFRDLANRGRATIRNIGCMREPVGPLSGIPASSRSPEHSDSPLKERGTSGKRSGCPASRLRIYGHYRDNRKNGRSDRGNPIRPPPREKVPETPFTPNRNPYTVFGTGPTAP